MDPQQLLLFQSKIKSQRLQETKEVNIKNKREFHEMKVEQQSNKHDDQLKWTLSQNQGLEMKWERVMEQKKGLRWEKKSQGGKGIEIERK